MFRKRIASVNQSCGAPTVSAIVAPRAPRGFGVPVVVSWTVWCSVSALSSAPINTTMIDSQIQTMNAMMAPRRTVSLVVTTEILRVPRKQYRNDEPGHRCDGGGTFRAPVSLPKWRPRPPLPPRDERVPEDPAHGKSGRGSRLEKDKLLSGTRLTAHALDYSGTDGGGRVPCRIRVAARSSVTSSLGNSVRALVGIGLYGRPCNSREVAPCRQPPGL